MSEHTPGPWTIRDDPGHTFSDGAVDHGGYRIDAPNVEQLAFVWRDNRRFGSDEPFGAAEAEANACLIAAAPDMLVLLKMLSGMDHHHTILAAIDATIARATGGQS